MSSDILVVEDNPTTCASLRSALERRGHTVRGVGTGQDALDAVLERIPDLVVQDLVLPDMDGFELAAQIRTLPRAGKIPIVALSGFISRTQPEGASIFAEFIAKPVRPEAFASLVESHLKGEQEAVGSGKKILVVDDDDVQRKLVKILLEKRGFRVTTARDGQEALEMAGRSLPDAIISDVLMPRMDGYHFVHSLRQDDRFVRTPVLLLSNFYVGEEDGRMATACGATALLTRPAEPNRLEQEILGHLGTPAVKEVLESSVKPAAAVHQIHRLTEVHLSRERRLALYETALAMLSHLSRLLRWGESPDRILSELLPQCLDAAGLSQGAIYLLDEDGVLNLAAQEGFPEPERESVRRMFDRSSTFHEVLRSGVPCRIESKGSRTLALLPMYVGTERLGVFVAGSGEAEPGTEWMAFARVLGGQIAQIVTLTRSQAGFMLQPGMVGGEGPDEATGLAALIGKLLHVGDDSPEVTL